MLNIFKLTDIINHPATTNLDSLFAPAASLFVFNLLQSNKARKMCKAALGPDMINCWLSNIFQQKVSGSLFSFEDNSLMIIVLIAKRSKWSQQIMIPFFSVREWSNISPFQCDVETATGLYSCLSVDMMFKRQVGPAWAERQYWRWVPW